jgi:hypothetical protein
LTPNGVEEKGVLLLTIPALLGLIFSDVFAVSVGLVRFEKAIPSWIVQIAILIMFCCAHFAAPGQTDKIG